jgi:hypothetical protein
VLSYAQGQLYLYLTTAYIALNVYQIERHFEFNQNLFYAPIILNDDLVEEPENVLFEI